MKMKNKYDTIPEWRSEQEPIGKSFGLNELWSKYNKKSFAGWNKYVLRVGVIACNSGTEMRVRDSSATRIFFKKNRMMQHRAQKITTKF